MLLLAFLGHSLYGQDGSKLYENKEKEQFVSISGSMQFWLRHTSLNPGSMVFNEEMVQYWDMSIRRYRLKFSGKANKKTRFHFEFGNNDLNFYNMDRGTPHLLDAYVDHQFHEAFAIGAGKHAWAGLARYSAPSSIQALAYDLDFVAAPYVNVYDDILRRMGVYARGAYQGFDYRLVLAKPANANVVSRTISENASFSDRLPEYQFSSYLKYQFLDHESQASPYAPGTYLGKKNILNLGFGSMHQPNTSWFLNESDTVYHTARSLAADLFFEKALPKNKGITFYLAFIRHDMGKNFMRYMGANNPATGGLPTDYVNGRGNNAPVIGTGNIWYMQIGYIRPADSNNQTQLQPYASLEYAKFDALNEPVLIYNTGINYILNSHRSKISLGYQSRPVFKEVEHLIIEEMRKDMLVVQYQILFGG